MATCCGTEITKPTPQGLWRLAALKLLPSRPLVPATGEVSDASRSAQCAQVGWVLTVLFSLGELIFRLLGCWEL